MWSDQRWATAVAAVRRHATKHGTTYPKPGELVLPDGRDMRIWLMNTRHAYRKGKLPAHRIADLEAIPDWTWTLKVRQYLGTGGDRYRLGVRKLAAWVRANGRLPREHSAAPESGLAVLVRDCRRLHRGGDLDPATVATLEQIPGWSWPPPPEPAETPQQRLTRLRAFIRGQNRWPSITAADRGEALLARWARAQYREPTLKQQVQTLREETRQHAWVRDYKRVWAATRTTDTGEITWARAWMRRAATKPPPAGTWPLPHITELTVDAVLFKRRAARLLTAGPLTVADRKWLHNQQRGPQPLLPDWQRRIGRQLADLPAAYAGEGFESGRAANAARVAAAAAAQTRTAQQLLHRAEQGETQLTARSRMILQARVTWPAASMADLGARTGYTKDQVAGVLRRTLAPTP